MRIWNWTSISVSLLVVLLGSCAAVRALSPRNSTYMAKKAVPKVSQFLAQIQTRKDLRQLAAKIKNNYFQGDLVGICHTGGKPTDAVTPLDELTLRSVKSFNSPSKGAALVAQYVREYRVGNKKFKIYTDAKRQANTWRISKVTIGCTGKANDGFLSFFR